MCEFVSFVSQGLEACKADVVQLPSKGSFLGQVCVLRLQIILLFFVLLLTDCLGLLRVSHGKSAKNQVNLRFQQTVEN